MITETEMGDSSKLWTPDPEGAAWQGNTLDETVQAYTVFLQVCYPKNLKQFQDRLASDPDAARAEATVFSWLRSVGLAPTVNEDPSQGGADFLCLPGEPDSFLLEVTSLSKDAVVDKSGWPDELTERAGAFSMVVPQISRRVQGKVPQLARGPEGVARVLAVCLAHQGASAMLGTMAAEWAMTSTPAIRMMIPKEGESSEPPRLATDLKQSAFFGLKEGAIVPMREAISAILLVSVWERQLEIVGMLHPAPKMPLEYRRFGDIPFLRAEWPIKNEEINTEWVVGNPRPVARYHNKVVLTAEELTGS